jgi:hypothetical protein
MVLHIYGLYRFSGYSDPLPVSQQSQFFDLDCTSAGFPANLGVHPIVDSGSFILLHWLQLRLSIKIFASHIAGGIALDRYLRGVIVGRC